MSKQALSMLAAVGATMILTAILDPLSYIRALVPTAQAQQQSGCRTFGQTGKTVCGKFLTYWQNNGGLQQFGFPLSAEFIETSDLNGKQYTVQYFERAVFEMHPENQPPYDVLLSQLGTFRFRQKYPNGEPGSAPTPVATPVSPPTLGDRVELRPGVSIGLINQVQAAVTGIQTGNCGTEMTWVFQTSNNSNTPFVVNLDTSSLSMTDNTGKSYALSQACGGLPYSGSFATPITLAPGEVHKGYIAFQAQDVPSAATHFDLYMNLSGTPLIFRYTFP